MKELDLKGLKCPLPVLRLRRFIRDHLDIGGQVEVSTTDPMSQLDIPHYCNDSGQKLISSDLNEDVCIFIVEKQIHISQNQ